MKNEEYVELDNAQYMLELLVDEIKYYFSEMNHTPVLKHWIESINAARNTIQKVLEKNRGVNI